MHPSLFEGPEKKVEIVLREGHPPLRGYGEARWREIVAAAGAEILGKLSNEVYDAYLLSESSLFVRDHVAVMITCGKTQLVHAVERMFELVGGAAAVQALFYERKRGHFPDEQPTQFLDDARRLEGLIAGRAFQLGTSHDHAIDVFHSTEPYPPAPEDRTIEVLMHGIDEHVRAGFKSLEPRTAGTVAARLGFDAILQGFEYQEHVFEPAGYSLNGLRGTDYLTIHVTPQRIGSYVSFETNVDFRADPSTLVAGVVTCFRPEAFDVVAFVPDPTPLSVRLDGYSLREDVREAAGGHEVIFQHFARAI